MTINPTAAQLAEWRAKGLIPAEAATAKGSPEARLPTVGELAAAAVIDWCRRHALSVPVAEYRFAPPRRWRFDLAWVELKLAVEFQGGTYNRGRHVRAEGFEADCEKFTEAVVMGWRVMPVTYRQFHKGLLMKWLARYMGAKVDDAGCQPGII